MTARILIVTPVFNEAAHVEKVARALAAQTLPPARWVVVDDGSTDGTVEILSRLERELDFLEIVERPQERRLAGDRLAGGAAPRAFNWGLEQVEDRASFTHIGKLDGDIELPPDYFERLLARFVKNAQLGLAGGVLDELHGSEWKRVRIPPTHVHGALKLYSAECFAAIGGVRTCLGWDAIDQCYARMLGWDARSFHDIAAVHHRHWGSAQGTLRGRARHGAGTYIAQQPFAWAVLRSIKHLRTRPYVLSGAAFLYGYVAAGVKRTPRIEDPEFKRFVRRELRNRVLKRLSRGVSRSPVPAASPAVVGKR